MNVRNILFQAAWKVQKQFYRSKGPYLSYHLDAMLAQVRLAKRFGQIDFAILGDSNAFGFEPEMTKLKGLAVNLGKPGSRVDQWLDALSTERGQTLIWLLQGAKIILNMGGNNAIQNVMEPVEGSMRGLSVGLPTAIMINCPPVHLKFLEAASTIAGVRVSAEEMGERVARVNQVIERYFKGRILDAHSAFIDPKTSEAYPGILKDPIHYGKAAREWMISVINRL